jgi:hypothetical protein
VAQVRVENGHNDTCSGRLVPNTPCTCGHDNLKAALENDE